MDKSDVTSSIREFEMVYMFLLYFFSFHDHCQLVEGQQKRKFKNLEEGAEAKLFERNYIVK